MKTLLILATVMGISQATQAKVAVCKAVVEGKTLTVELLTKKQGTLIIEENGEKIRCDLSVFTIEDLRAKGIIPVINVDLVREFQCSPATPLESKIPKELTFRLHFDTPQSVRGDFKWKNYSPRAECEVQELDLASAGFASFKGTLKRLPAAKQPAKKQ